MALYFAATLLFTLCSLSQAQIGTLSPYSRPLLTSHNPNCHYLSSKYPGNTRNSFNTNPSSSSSLSISTFNSITPRPSGGDIPLSTTIQGGSASSVKLIYRINYDENEYSLTMEQGVSAADGGGKSSYSAIIPASDATPGSMVRWYVVVTDSQGQQHRDPPYTKPTDQQYYGTIVQLPEQSSSSLPLIELYCQDEKAPYNADKNTTSPCSLLYNGTAFYDNISVHRRGMTSLNWPKPKFKIESGSQGKIFELIPGMPYKVKSIDLNSEWAEPGENTFMRETLAWQTFRQMGVDSLLSFQSVVYLNGKYYGKFAISEEWGVDSLRANGYSVDPKPGVLLKSESGEYSNLRWDIPSDQVQYYYGKVTVQDSSADTALVELTKGLAGGGSLPRSKYVFDWINLPKTINHLAAQTVLLNQDRCTKNFYIYLDPSSNQWSMLPWDIESAFSIDRGLGGQPAPDYCILACEQWNSPLYCDANHPQDLAVKTPWGLITTQINTNTPVGGRRLMDDDGANNNNGAASPGQPLPPSSSISPNYDADQTRNGPTKTGAPGTYNYLIDALLSIPRTRSMYMRRVRTLMDEFLSTGRLQGIVSDEYAKIKDEAKRDAAKWGNPGSVDRGYQQLMSEQLPIRKDQLYGKYSVGGDTPLIPDGQPSSVSLSINKVQPGTDGYIQITNNNDYAVDISGWKVRGNGVSFSFVPGTVIPPNDSVYIAAVSISTFKKRKNGPSGGQGLFVVGPLSGELNSSDGITLSRQ